MLLACPSPVRYVCCLPLIELARPSPMFVMSIVFPLMKLVRPVSCFLPLLLARPFSCCRE